MKLTLSIGIAVFVLSLGNLFAQGSSPEELYKKQCVKCHADDGSGKKDGEPLKVAKTLKLKDPELLNILRDDAKKATDADMEKVILEGKDKMKGMKDKISAEEAKALVQYVRTLQNKK